MLKIIDCFIVINFVFQINSTESSKDSSVQKVLSGVNTLKIEDTPDKGFFRMRRYVTRNNKINEVPFINRIFHCVSGLHNKLAWEVWSNERLIL